MCKSVQKKDNRNQEIISCGEILEAYADGLHDRSELKLKRYFK